MIVCGFLWISKGFNHSLLEMQQTGMLQFMLNLIITSLESCCRGCHVLTFAAVILEQGAGWHVLLAPITDVVTCYWLTLVCLPSLHWSSTAVQMTTQDLLRCKYRRQFNTLIATKDFYFTKLMLVLFVLFSGRAILMQITKTRMWGKGTLTRCWKRCV